MNATVKVNFDGACLGVMGEAGDRTVVRPTTCGQYAVIEAATGRIIKVFADSYTARQYNAAIHGESL